MGGVQSDFPNTFKLRGCLKTENLRDYKDIIKYLEEIPRYLHQIQILLQKGIDTGYTYHEASMSRVERQFENLLNYGKIENSTFYRPFSDLIGNSDEVIEIQEEAKKVIHHSVMPAFEKLRKFLRDEYSR